VQEEIAVAVNEVAANAVEHAYGLDDASFAVAAQLRPDRVTVVVEDRGRWRRERGHENRGRGLDLARALVDDVEVHTGDQGTTVRLERLLPAAGGRGVARG
jgi:anti-sigma regulatory factor (Ser/Thr protein kinase)